MHQFHRYDPARPRTVTSFKGNQKLIFEGYRYNIHHIVPAKGVKTWRCVCAKKLNGSRSWCKGRAETWDGDSHGVSKGEHNHPAEHEVAELEFFRSQLILAAISSPQANLNDLIDEATSLMSEGVNFGSRESLKKSLTGARKQAENGGFKLKCYKSADKPIKNLAYNKLVRHQPMLINGGPKSKETSKDGEQENVLRLLTLAKAKGKELSTTSTTACRANACSAFSSPSSVLDSSGFASASSSFSSSSPPTDGQQPPSSTLLMTIAAAAVAFGTGIGNKKGRTEATIGTPNSQQREENEQLQRKKARVNSIFDRLSTKAAAAAASSYSSNSGHSLASSPSAEMKQVMEEGEGKPEEKGTQTEEEEEEEGDAKLGAAAGVDDCKCRLVRICCCGDKANCRAAGRKRRRTEERPVPHQQQQEMAVDHREQSAPPSSCSSVENQPHLTVSPAKELCMCAKQPA